jgi:hypothetical protein
MAVHDLSTYVCLGLISSTFVMRRLWSRNQIPFRLRTVYEEMHDCASDRIGAEQRKSSELTAIHGAEDTQSRSVPIDDILGYY